MKISDMKQNSGFTLVEMMVTVALVAIVVAFGIPSMTEFSKNDRLTTNINTLIGHLSYARSEAVKQSVQVALCVSNNSNDPNPSCTGGNWEDGWIVYVDADGDDSFTAGEEVLRVQPALEGSNTLTPGGGIANQVIYDYRGFAGVVGTFLLCDNRAGPHGKTVTITNTGRVRAEGESPC